MSKLLQLTITERLTMTYYIKQGGYDMTKKQSGKKNGLTRRGFLKTTGGAALAGVAAGGLLAGSRKVSGAEMPQKWDEEADVLVLGFGGAGASAAIEAHDAGAKVLIIEKQPMKTHYSNTRMSGGIFHCPDSKGNRAALKEYAKAMFSGENIPWKFEGEQPQWSDGLAEAWAEYAPQNIDFLKKLDPDYGVVAFKAFKGAAFPNFPGAGESGYAVFGSSYTGKASFNTPTKDLPKAQKMNGEAFFTALKNGVDTRKIKILYETPAKRLVTSNQGEVIGAIAMTSEGKEIACKAKRGVIVTTGGYEYNLNMRQAFLEGPGVEGWAFYGSTDNTGDGIEMSIKIGAALAKVGKAASRMIAAVPLRKHKMKIGMITPAVGKGNSIVVDSYGNRYTAEHLITKDPSRYLFYKEAVKMDILKLLYPRVPSWLVFDETLRTKRTITYLGLSTAAYDFVPWTKDNMDAIKRGWIMKADTLEALAEQIKKHPENRKLLKTKNLVNSVQRFNTFCEAGKDEDYGRLKSTLKPVNTPPFYAMPVYPGGPNTKGGIAANAKREVLDWEGKPIPRLFSAGEISSTFKFVYQGGGNLTECLVFGRIAGMSAAAMTPWG